jgi:predicted Zn-dependent protease
MLRFVLVALSGTFLAGCQLAGRGTPPRVEPVAVVAPRLPSAAEEAIGARENPRVVAEYGGVYEDSSLAEASWSVSSPPPTTRPGATRSPS